MNTIFKKIAVGLTGIALMAFTAYAQPHHGKADGVSGPTPAMAEAPAPHPQCFGGLIEFTPVRSCYIPQMKTFVVVDSVDCAVDMLRFAPEKDSLVRVGRFVTEDNLKKRHDLKNIVRPKSVSVVGHRVVVLASAVNDSSYIAVLAMCPGKEMTLVAKRAFKCHSDAFEATPEELIVVGHNNVGYDINTLSLRDCGLDNIAEAPLATMHYHKPKQAEKIKQSDPVGIGLTAVAVSVVFLALVCIALIIQGTSKLVSNVEKKDKPAKKGEDAAAAETSQSANKDGEILAAIGAAIHLYNDELHDEEDTVITIQKVERAWTPWNAKYYNMNHYFNRR